MTFEQLRFFVVAVESSSFFDAADQLHTTQSTLSKQIRKMEEELQVQLFDRSRRFARLTLAGEAFYQEATTLLSAYHHSLQVMQPFRKNAENHLRIGTLPILSQYDLTSRIHSFLRENPQIIGSISEVEESDLLAGMEQDLYDLVIVRASLIDSETYHFDALTTDRLCAILPAGHALAGRDQVSIVDIASAPLILMHAYTAIHTLCLSMFAKASLEPHILRTARMESIISAVAAYEGISLLPESSFRLFRNDSVISIPLSDAPALYVGIAYKKGRRLAPAARKFIEFMQ